MKTLIALLILLPQAEDLPDFSRAGYHSGEKELPRPKATANVRAFGAKGDGRTDDTKALQAALARGGVIEIPEGRWVLTDVLLIESDNVILRGAGSGKTILVCPKSLTDIKGPDRNWSWSGGMIQIRPKGSGEQIGTVEGKAGETELTIALREGRDPPEAGEWLQLCWFNDKGEDTLLDSLYGGVVPRNRMGRELQESTSARVREWIEVKKVDGAKITIGQPLRIDARPAWTPKIHRAPTIREVGVEGIAFEFPETKYPGHLKEKGYNGIALSSAVHCWVRDVATTNADSGIFLGACRYVTVDGFAARGRYMHHVLSVSWGSDNLITNWRIEAPHRHGTTISWCAHGNVFSNGWGRNLAMDAHRAASFENLHTNVTIRHEGRVYYPFRSGGSGPRGPHSARSNVYWNIVHEFPEGEGPVKIGPVREWPLGVFAGWRGNRPIRMDPIESLRQRVIDLNKESGIKDLRLHQLKTRPEK